MVDSPKQMIKSPKRVVHKSTFNPRAKIAKNYNIIVLGSLPNLGEDPKRDTNNTSIVKL